MARKILLADDSVTAQNMGRKILVDAGYEVIAVNNGSAALKKFAEVKPDLVVLDVYMPGYSGLEVCQRLKESGDSARTPVLLTVGKLEPFKPEEAQRVRAEGFIVKPFEASELLSALSKLEDKVVPRAEPSKGGRFARAFAAADAAERSQTQTPADGGWKSRIGFPEKKSESEEKPADDAAIYNPVNRDLRTVVETPSEKAAQEVAPAALAEKAGQGEPVVEPSLDVAALAPAGLPKDVSPEEVAAIAAAAAQIQAAEAASKTDRDTKPTQELGAEAPSQLAVQAPVETLVAEKPAEVVEELRVEPAAVTADEPVTMAAVLESQSSAETAPRWTAVSVALEGDEAAVSLEQEMQKAFAAITPQETAPAAIVEEKKAIEAVASAAEQAVVASENVHSESAAAELVAPPEPVAIVEAAPPVEFAQRSAHVEEMMAEAATPIEAMATRTEESAEAVASSSPEIHDSAAEDHSTRPSSDGFVSFMSPVTTAYAERNVSSAAIPSASDETAPDGVKTSAAAWASWRQIHDTNRPPDTEAQSNDARAESAAEVSSVEAAALAAAAGADQGAPSANGDTKDVASIVDSVLADLRPKLMEEIARKMGKK